MNYFKFDKEKDSLFMKILYLKIRNNLKNEIRNDKDIKLVKQLLKEKHPI